MVTSQRWLRAQAYERNFWAKTAKDIENGAVSQLGWYQWRATQLKERLSKLRDAQAIVGGQVLEIGSGPIGIVNFLDSGNRFAIDPLEEFYRESSVLSQLRQPGVAYLKGAGEDLPFPDASFSLLIIDNVIDHTRSPERILRESHRVLRRDGLMYLTVNVHTRWGAMVHRLFATLNIDRGHPHTFLQETTRQLLSRTRFVILQEQIEDYHDVKRTNRTSRRISDKIKGYTGLFELNYQVVCRKESA